MSFFSIICNFDYYNNYEIQEVSILTVDAITCFFPSSMLFVWLFNDEIH